MYRHKIIENIIYFSFKPTKPKLDTLLYNYIRTRAHTKKSNTRFEHPDVNN